MFRNGSRLKHSSAFKTFSSLIENLSFEIPSLATNRNVCLASKFKKLNIQKWKNPQIKCSSNWHHLGAMLGVETCPCLWRGFAFLKDPKILCRHICVGLELCLRGIPYLSFTQARHLKGSSTFPPCKSSRVWIFETATTFWCKTQSSQTNCHCP